MAGGVTFLSEILLFILMPSFALHLSHNAHTLGTGSEMARVIAIIGFYFTECICVIELISL